VRADGTLQIENEDFAVPNLAGLGRVGNGGDRFVEQNIRDRDFDFCFWHEGDDVFGAAVDFRVALLTPVSLGFGDGHPVHASRR
jgi:hypothetical protein